MSERTRERETGEKGRKRTSLRGFLAQDNRGIDVLPAMAFQSYHTEGASQHPLVLGHTFSARISRDVTCCRGMTLPRAGETARSAAMAHESARYIGAADSCACTRVFSRIGRTARAFISARSRNWASRPDLPASDRPDLDVRGNAR